MFTQAKVSDPRKLDPAPPVPFLDGVRMAVGGGVQIMNVGSGGSEYVFVSCTNGVYWVFNDQQTPTADSGQCFENLAGALLDAAESDQSARGGVLVPQLRSAEGALGCAS